MMMKLTSKEGLLLINTAHVMAVVGLVQGFEDPYKARIYVDGCEAESWFQCRETPAQIWGRMEKEVLAQQMMRRPLWKRITDYLGLTTI